MKRKLSVLLVSLLFILPLRVDAAAANLIVSCNKTTLAPGASTSCTLYVNVTEGSINDVDTKLVLSNNLSLVGNIEVDSSSFMGDAGDNHIAVFPTYTSEMTGKVKIATFTVKASASLTSGGSEKITTTSSEGTVNHDRPISLGDANVDIKVTSNVNTLSNITLSEGTLIPAFNKDITNYSVSLDKDKVNISAVKTDTKSTISGDVGEVNLNYGTNTFRINVKSESGTTKTYTILITRPDTRSSDTSLKSLKFISPDGSTRDVNTEGDIKLSYDNNVDKIEVKAELNSAKAKFMEGYGSRTVNLKEGDNEVLLKVVAENGEAKTYAIKIKRLEKNEIEEDDNNFVPDNDKDLSNNDKEENNKDDNVTNNTSKEEVTNPQTGSIHIVIIIVIAIAAILVAVYFYKKKEKIEVKSDEQK